jgi:hypothetical protein
LLTQPVGYLLVGRYVAIPVDGHLGTV